MGISIFLKDPSLLYVYIKKIVQYHRSSLQSSKERYGTHNGVVTINSSASFNYQIYTANLIIRIRPSVWGPPPVPENKLEKMLRNKHTFSSSPTVQGPDPPTRSPTTLTAHPLPHLPGSVVLVLPSPEVVIAHLVPQPLCFPDMSRLWPVLSVWNISVWLCRPFTYLIFLVREATKPPDYVPIYS